MNEPLRAVVVGAGYFAQFHIEAWQRLNNVELSAIVETNQQKATELRTRFPQVAIVTTIGDAAHHKPDVVDITTPPSTHADLIMAAFDHTEGLVICQKPFCGSIQAAAPIVQEAKKRSRTLVVHENFRFQPWHRRLKELLGNKAIGDVQQVTFRLRPGDGQGREAYLERQPYFQKMSRFLIHETGIHFVDVFRYLFGEPDQVSADLRQLNPHIRGEDAGYFTFVYDSGMRALFDGNRHLDHAAVNTRQTMGEMLLEGTTGSLKLNGDGDVFHREFGTINWKQIDVERNNAGFAGDCVYLLQRHVVHHLLNSTTLENTAAEYLKNQALEELIYQANDAKRMLPVSFGPDTG